MESVSVKNKAVVITGGTTGIGRATAILLASEGARLLVFGRGERELNDALKDIQKVGNAVGLTADTSKKDDVIRVFEKVDIELGGLDILIDNAALAAESISGMALWSKSTL